MVVVVRSKHAEPTDVTDFSAWRRAVGGGPVGFVITTSETEVLVDTCKMMARLPPGRYDAEMVRRVKLTQVLEKDLKGHDVWKSV